jgi:anti-sigma B factor antagonist
MNGDFSLTDLNLQAPIAVMKLTGRLNSLAARDLHMHCESLYDDGYTRLIIEMSGVTFIASSGAGTLVKMTYDFLERDGLFQIAAVSDPVLRVIDLLNCRQFLNIAADVDEAMENLDALNASG